MVGISPYPLDIFGLGRPWEASRNMIWQHADFVSELSFFLSASLILIYI